MNDIQKYESNLPTFNDEQIQLIKNLFCKGATDDEFKLFMQVCVQMNLNPLMKQIYSIPRGGQRTIQVSIEGYRLIAERTGKYAPGKESLFNVDKDGKLISATAYVKKQTHDGTWHEVSTTAFMCEYNGGNTFWKKMPFQMLNKCAESGALRKAFPAELSGTYTMDEMEQADKNIVEVEVVETEQEKERLLNNYVIDFSQDERVEMKKWLIKYADIKKVNIASALKDYSDKNLFVTQFYTWKTREEKRNKVKEPVVDASFNVDEIIKE